MVLSTQRTHGDVPISSFFHSFLKSGARTDVIAAVHFERTHPLLEDIWQVLNSIDGSVAGSVRWRPKVVLGSYRSGHQLWFCLVLHQILQQQPKISHSAHSGTLFVKPCSLKSLSWAFLSVSQYLQRVLRSTFVLLLALFFKMIIKSIPIGRKIA